MFFLPICQTFLETEWKKTISIPIIKNNTFTSNVEFYVILKVPEGGMQLGDPSVTRVTIIDDDGEFIPLLPPGKRVCVN